MGAWRFWTDDDEKLVASERLLSRQGKHLPVLGEHLRCVCQAEELAESGQLKEAQALLVKTAERFPKDATILVRLARVCCQLKDYEQGDLWMAKAEEDQDGMMSFLPAIFYDPVMRPLRAGMSERFKRSHSKSVQESLADSRQKAEEEEDEPAEAEATLPVCAPVRVLSVEGIDPKCEITEIDTALRKAGCEHFGVANYDEALEVLRDTPIDVVIICPFGFPGEDDWAFCSRVKAAAKGNRPGILISCEHDDETLKRLKQHPEDGWMPEVWAVGEIVLMVERLLRRQGKHIPRLPDCMAPVLEALELIDKKQLEQAYDSVAEGGWPLSWGTHGASSVDVRLLLAGERCGSQALAEADHRGRCDRPDLQHDGGIRSQPGIAP